MSCVGLTPSMFHRAFPTRNESYMLDMETLMRDPGRPIEQAEVQDVTRNFSGSIPILPPSGGTPAPAA